MFFISQEGIRTFRDTRGMLWRYVVAPEGIQIIIPLAFYQLISFPSSTANFWWDLESCMAESPNDARFTFEFKLSDLKAPVSCQEVDEIAAGYEYVIDNELPELAYSNVTTIGCATLWKNPDSGNTECGGCLGGLGYVGTTDAIFTEGISQPDSPWNENDPNGIYHHAHKVLTLVTMEIRTFSYDCKDAVCFQNLLVQTIETVQTFLTSGRFTLAVYEWSRFRGPPIEQLWLAEVDKSSFVQTSSLNPFIVSPQSPAGLEVSTAGKCAFQNVNGDSYLSSENVISNLQNATKTALYSLTGDTRIVGAGIVVEQSLVIQIKKICDQMINGIQEPIQCTESPPTFDFNLVMYLPYYADTRTFSIVMEDQLNNITSFHDALYQVSSCSLSDAEVVSLAVYYPDWFTYRSCINDGKCTISSFYTEILSVGLTGLLILHILYFVLFQGLQPQYMRDRPNDYLFERIEDCCEAHFAWDKSCGYNPMSVWYYPKYDEFTCYERPLGAFVAYNLEKYATKNICCMEKFGSVISTCCNEGEGECATTGIFAFVPNWIVHTCELRDTSLVPEWENDFVSSSIEECCEKCKCHTVSGCLSFSCV